MNCRICNKPMTLGIDNYICVDVKDKQFNNCFANYNTKTGVWWQSFDKGKTWKTMEAK